MVTFRQLLKTKRFGSKKKRRTSKTPVLNKNPQKRATVLKILIMTPRKPNSAQRKIARVKLKNNKIVYAYIQGEGHNLQEYSAVLLRGGRTKDLPGLKYKMIRGKLDFQPPLGKKKQRSKYGIKKK